MADKINNLVICLMGCNIQCPRQNAQECRNDSKCINTQPHPMLVIQRTHIFVPNETCILHIIDNNEPCILCPGLECFSLVLMLHTSLNI